MKLLSYSGQLLLTHLLTLRDGGWKIASRCSRRHLLFMLWHYFAEESTLACYICETLHDSSFSFSFTCKWAHWAPALGQQLPNRMCYPANELQMRTEVSECAAYVCVSQIFFWLHEQNRKLCIAQEADSMLTCIQFNFHFNTPGMRSKTTANACI